MNAKQLFCCPTCLESHESEEDAVICCPLYPTSYWECGECMEDHKSESEAEACCREVDERVSQPSSLTPQELEAMGQERLFA